MIRKPSTLRKVLVVGLMLTVGSFSTLTSVSVLAQAAPKAAGELAIIGNVTLNGVPALAGATVFSNSKIKTLNGSATINLGRLGRIELGQNAEMSVRFADNSIGGNLLAGRASLSAPAGVAVSVATAEGMALSEGKQPSLLTVDVSCGNTRVAAARGEIKLMGGSKVETVAAGSEAAIGQQPATANRCARLAGYSKAERWTPAAIALLVIAGIGGAVAGIIAATGDRVTPSGIVVSGFRPTP